MRVRAARTDEGQKRCQGTPEYWHTLPDPPPSVLPPRIMDMITLLPSLFLSLPSFLLSFLPLFSLPPSLGWPRRPRREREVREEEGREKEERRTRKKTRTHTRRRARREGRRDGREREEGKTGGGERAERGVGKKDAEAARRGRRSKKDILPA